jgi:hypothetical protein
MYGRVGLGQIGVVGERMDHFAKKTGKFFYQMAEILNSVKTELTGFHPNASYGVGNKEVPDRFMQAIDMYQVIRHKLAWDNNPEGGVTVDFHEPSRYGKQALCKIK